MSVRRVSSSVGTCVAVFLLNALWLVSLSPAQAPTPVPAPPTQPALVVWAGVDALDPLARTLERMVAVHNQRNSERMAVVRFVAPAVYSEKVFQAQGEELPPDLLIVPSPLARQMADKGLLVALEGDLGRAKIERGDLYPAAWKTVESGGRLWGLPLGGEMRLLYANLDALARAGRPTESLATAAGEAEGTWDDFLKGKAAACEASSTQLKALIEAKPTFAWKVYAQVGERIVAQGTYRTLALVVYKKQNMKPVEAMFPLWRTALEPGFGALLWVEGSQLPVHPPARTPEQADLLAPVGAWMDGWMRAAE